MTYLYNGVELPALPEWDKTAYPYALIIYSPLFGIAHWQLYVGQEVIYRQVTSGYQVGFSNYKVWDTLGGEWNYKTTNEEETYIVTVGASYLKWSNFDILNSDGTIYLAASEPVPIVQHVTESKGDGYALYNGVKVLASEVPDGAESIPLDGMNVIEWDGVTEGLESLGDNYVKVAEFENASVAVAVSNTNGKLKTGIAFTEESGNWMTGIDEAESPLVYALNDEGGSAFGVSSGIYAFYVTYEGSLVSYISILAYTPATTEEPEEPAPTPPSPQTAFCIGKAFGRMIRNAMKPQ